MAERQTNNNFSFAVAEALRQYVTLLNHYQISQEAQDAVLTKMMEEEPKVMIELVTQYWEETFGSNHHTNNHNGKDGPLPEEKPLEVILYESRKEQWQDHLGKTRKKRK